MFPPPAAPVARIATLRVGRVVALVAVLLAVALGAWWHFILTPPLQHLVLFFEDNVSGLYTGSTVKTHGVTIGQVESLGLRVPGVLGGSIHAEVRIALESRKMEALGLPRDLSNREQLNAEIANGLRGKLVLLSATSGDYGIELTHDPFVRPVRISAPEEGLAEIPVIPNMLSGEKLDTLTDALVAFSRSDFERLAREWDESLDSALTATAPERVRLPVREFSARLENATALLADSRVRDDLRDINEKLLHMRKTLEGSETDILRHSASLSADMAGLRQSLDSVNAWLAQLAAQCAPVSPQLRSLAETLESVREIAEKINQGNRRR
jgi:ABC-type transporter Mla subunit MlaD